MLSIVNKAGNRFVCRLCCRCFHRDIIDFVFTHCTKGSKDLKDIEAIEVNDMILDLFTFILTDKHVWQFG